jgi:hypothetical protein
MSFLSPPPDGIADVVASRVQDVPLDCFDDLAEGDVLFVDSSHVSKTGSDVNHLLFEVLPRLAQGVRIHFHDVFLPYPYDCPRDWVLKSGIYWNEQYLLRALLSFSAAYRVVFGSACASAFCTDEVCTALSLAPGSIYSGGSFWIEKRVRP